MVLVSRITAPRRTQVKPLVVRPFGAFLALDIYVLESKSIMTGTSRLQ